MIKSIKSINTKLLASLSVAVMALSVVLPSFVGIAQADPVTKTVYIDVEKNVLNKSPLLEPVAVALSDTYTILDATKQAYELVYGTGSVDVNTSGTYDYIEAFKDTSTAFTYDYTDDIDDATNGVVYRTDLPDTQPIVSDQYWLREQEYNGISGWMFTVNNEVQYGGSNWYNAETPLSALPDNAVIRWEFSEAFGADLGRTDAYVPTAVTLTGYYDWNTSVPFAARFDRADKTNLISKMALNKTDPDYPEALDALKELTIGQSDVDDVAALLP